MQEFPLFPSPLKIRYKGVFDFEGVYNTIYHWFRDRQFRFHEQRFKTKAHTALGNEFKLNLWAEREDSEYYKYYAKMFLHLWESKEIPVIIDGKQVMRMKGRMHIDIEGSVITDWQKRYHSDVNFLHKMMENFLNKTVLKYDIDMKHVDVFDKELHRLEHEIKKVLKMETDESGVFEWV